MSGLTAIAASTIALIALVTRSQWPVTWWTPWLAGTLELGGLLAAIVLMGGIWLGSPKRRWLESPPYDRATTPMALSVDCLRRKGN